MSLTLGKEKTYARGGWCFISGFLVITFSYVLSILLSKMFQVLHKVVLDPSIPIIPRGKANSMGDIGQHSLAPHSHHNRGLMDMTRYYFLIPILVLHGLLLICFC